MCIHKVSLLPVLLMIMLLMIACGGTSSLATAPVASPPLSFTPIPTFTKVPTPLLPTIPLPMPTVTAPAGDFVPFSVIVSADNVNLRTQPGTLFPVSRLLAKGTHLRVLGHAPGDEWLYVQLDNIYGWILFWLVNAGESSISTPLVQPDSKATQLVTGQILDRVGVPISGIGFAVTQGTGNNAPRIDATTDGEGRFYAFLPRSASGTWLVSYVSVSCTSNTMGTSCNCIGGACGKADPGSVSVTLPYAGMLEFTWK
jgi:hypothetical protein